MLEKREEKKHCKEKYETTTTTTIINTETLGVWTKGGVCVSGGGDPELCLRGRWVEGRACVQMQGGKKKI